MASKYGWRVRLTYVDQESLQSTYDWDQKLCMRPYPQQGLRQDQMPQLLRLIYELTEAGDNWCQSLERFLREDLGSTVVPGDAPLYVSKKSLRKRGPARLIETYVDDTLINGVLKNSHTNERGS